MPLNLQQAQAIALVRVNVIDRIFSPCVLKPDTLVQCGAYRMVPFVKVHLETIVRHIICEPVRQAAALSKRSRFHTAEIAYVAA